MRAWHACLVPAVRLLGPATTGPQFAWLVSSLQPCMRLDSRTTRDDKGRDAGPIPVYSQKLSPQHFMAPNSEHQTK
ncbi:hypothetical protein B0H66DRAFT_542193 [Apodospora peruviana]|uniref:Secreted protein n=1 Tax=Apodospora peruviana TaxID=516989 RepID=A0AAE0IRA6_9PEZI|nr:hypothetical protein B0H66DRAFT_542193 [Apodospora peruviana]